MSQTIFVPVGYALTLTTPVDAAGSYYLIGNPGDGPGAPTAILANTTVVVGPFNNNRQYAYDVNNGDMTVAVAQSGVVTAVDDAALALKAPLASPTFTGTVVLPSTTSISSVSNTELSYLDGVTSALQTQLDTKLAFPAAPTITVGGSMVGTTGIANLVVGFGTNSLDPDAAGVPSVVWQATQGTTGLENITTMNYGTTGSISSSGTWTSLTSLVASSAIIHSSTATAASLTTLTLPVVKVLSTSYTPTYAALTTLALPSLKYAFVAFSPVCALCTTLTLTALSVVGTSFNPTLASVTSFTLPALTKVGTTFNPTMVGLVTFSFPNTLLSIGGNVSIIGAALNQASVNSILVSLAALDGTAGTTAYSSKTINLSGGTSASPSGAGLTAKTALEARSCTVTVN